MLPEDSRSAERAVRLPGGERWRLGRFKIPSATEAGGSVTAHPADFDGAGFVADETETVELSTARRLAEGDVVWAVQPLDRASHIWEVLALPISRPTIIHAAVDAAVTTEDATITIKSVDVVQPDGAEFTDPGGDDPPPTEVANLWRFPAAENAPLLAWRAGTGWYGLPRPTVTDCEEE
jgi:hypothetical protein